MPNAYLAIILFCLLCSTQAHVVTFGVAHVAQPDTLLGYEIWQSWWNNLPSNMRVTAWGDVIDVQVYVTTVSHEDEMLSAYEIMAQNHSIDFLFGPGDVAIRQRMSDLGVTLMLDPMESSQEFYAIPGSFGSRTADIFVMSSTLLELQLAQAKSIIVVSVNDYCRSIISQAASYGIHVVAYYDDIYPAILEEIINLNPDALAICAESDMEVSLAYFKRKNWVPKSLVTYPLPNVSDKSLLDFVMVPTAYAICKYPAQDNFLDSQGLYDFVQTHYSQTPTPNMVDALLAGMMYTNMLTYSSSNSSNDLVTTMRTQQLSSFAGLLAMDANNRQTRPMLVAQMMNSAAKIIGPSQAVTDDFVYPMPKWSERKYGCQVGKWDGNCRYGLCDTWYAHHRGHDSSSTGLQTSSHYPFFLTSILLVYPLWQSLGLWLDHYLDA